MATATERLLRPRDVKAIFASFVQNANALGKQAQTARASFDGDTAGSSDRWPTARAELDSLGESRHIDLSESVPIDAAEEEDDWQPSQELTANVPWESVVPPPGDDTAKHEAQMVVPDVSSVRPPEPGPRERSEDGEMPPRELERLMDDMAVLVRYSHEADVHRRLEELQREFPRDLLLLRRIAEFHIEQGWEDPSVECLFRLARGLFERRNVMGMRAALEQILVLRPEDARAHKLLNLLERRAD